ncbi:MAG: hypothetical protein IJ196_00315 [Prevotella sp.]|nr:hypothetical protein [Prevotella sp.]
MGLTDIAGETGREGITASETPLFIGTATPSCHDFKGFSADTVAILTEKAALSGREV